MPKQNKQVRAILSDDRVVFHLYRVAKPGTLSSSPQTSHIPRRAELIEVSPLTHSVQVKQSGGGYSRGELDFLLPTHKVRPNGSNQNQLGLRYLASNISSTSNLYLRGMRQIDALLKCTSTWAGSAIEPPTLRSIWRAKRVYRQLAQLNLLPERIISSGEGGVAFCFLRGDKYADMEILNSGEWIASTRDRIGGDSEIWEFSKYKVIETIRRIRGFLNGNRGL